MAQGGRRTQALLPCWAEMLHRMAPGKRRPRGDPVPFKAGRPSEESLGPRGNQRGGERLAGGGEPTGWEKMGHWNGLHLGGWGCYKLVIAFLVTSNREPQNNVLRNLDFSFFWPIIGGLRQEPGPGTAASQQHQEARRHLALLGHPWHVLRAHGPRATAELQLPLLCSPHDEEEQVCEGRKWPLRQHSKRPFQEPGAHSATPASD